MSRPNILFYNLDGLCSSVYSFGMHREHKDAEEEDDEDFIGQAEKEFWNLLAQEQKDIQAKEDKRREALMPKNQPTPIPEEGEERRDDAEDSTVTES